MFFSKEIFICLRASLVAALWGVLSLSAYAQGIADLFDAKSQKLLGSVMSGQARAASGNTGKTASSGGAGQSAALDVLGSFNFGGDSGEKSDYRYRYDPKVSVNLINQLAKAVAEEAGVSEKELVDSFNAMNLVEKISAALEAKGYAKHSLATAAAYWRVINFEIIYGTEFTDKQNDAELRKMEQSMADGPEIGQLDDEYKQRLSEILIWQATMQYIAHQNALKEGPGATEATVQGARKTLAIFKINPDDYRLTAEGLVTK